VVFHFPNGKLREALIKSSFEELPLFVNSKWRNEEEIRYISKHWIAAQVGAFAEFGLNVGLTVTLKAP
jgi:hypothetical protein